MTVPAIVRYVATRAPVARTCADCRLTIPARRRHYRRIDGPGGNPIVCARCRQLATSPHREAGKG